jgi:hypothetical protein
MGVRDQRMCCDTGATAGYLGEKARQPAMPSQTFGAVSFAAYIGLICSGVKGLRGRPPRRPLRLELAFLRGLLDWPPLRAISCMARLDWSFIVVYLS